MWSTAKKTRLLAWPTTKSLTYPSLILNQARFLKHLMKTRLCWLPLGEKTTNRKSRWTIKRFRVDGFLENPESMETNPNRISKIHPTLQKHLTSARHQRRMGQKNFFSHWENQVAISLSPIKRPPQKNKKHKSCCTWPTWLSCQQVDVHKLIVSVAGQPPPPNVLPPEVRPYQGLINHWFPLIRPHQTLISRGWYIRGVGWLATT